MKVPPPHYLLLRLLQLPTADLVSGAAFNWAVEVQASTPQTLPSQPQDSSLCCFMNAWGQPGILMEIPSFSMSPASRRLPSPGRAFTHNTLRDQTITSMLGLVINILVSFINRCIITGAGFECYVWRAVFPVHPLTFHTCSAQFLLVTGVALKTKVVALQF